MISSFCREVAENCALLGYYAASSGNLLPTFRDELSSPNFRGQESLKTGPIDFPETSITNYHYSLRKNPEERGSNFFFCFPDICLYHFLALWESGLSIVIE